MALVATKDSNPIYSAYDITFSAQTNTPYQNHSFYCEPVLVVAAAVHKDPDTSCEDKPWSLSSRRPAVWKQGRAVQSNKAALEIFDGMWIWVFVFLWERSHICEAVYLSATIRLIISSIQRPISFNHPTHFSLEGCKIGAYFHSGLVGGMVTAVLWSTHWLGIIDMLSQAGSGPERRHSSPQKSQCVSRGLQTWIGPLSVSLWLVSL